MKYDYSKLAGRITEKFKSNYKFAAALGISDSSISAKLNNKTSFSQKEILESIELLSIPVEELKEYFFKQKI
jgi:ORF5